MVIVIFRADLVFAINSSCSFQKDIYLLSISGQGKIEFWQTLLFLPCILIFEIEYYKALLTCAIEGVMPLGPEILA